MTPRQQQARNSLLANCWRVPKEPITYNLAVSLPSATDLLHLLDTLYLERGTLRLPLTPFQGKYLNRKTEMSRVQQFGSMHIQQSDRFTISELENNQLSLQLNSEGLRWLKAGLVSLPTERGDWAVSTDQQQRLAFWVYEDWPVQRA